MYTYYVYMFNVLYIYTTYTYTYFTRCCTGGDCIKGVYLEAFILNGRYVKFKITSISRALQNVNIFWNKYLALYVIVFLKLQKLSWFAHACSVQTCLYYLRLIRCDVRCEAFEWLR